MLSKKSTAITREVYFVAMSCAPKDNWLGLCALVGMCVRNDGSSHVLIVPCKDGTSAENYERTMAYHLASNEFLKEKFQK